MEKREYRYEIDGKIYIQRALVLGQISQIIEILKGIEIPSTIDALGVVKLLENKLPDVLAIVLVEEGTKLKDKDLAELVETLRESMSIETAIEVTENFFDLNRIASVFEKLTGIMTLIRPLKTKKQTGSETPSSPSPEEGDIQL
jgi:hypothetical protein